MIESIIEILTENKSLTSALLKTQVLATRLDNDNLRNWVTQELQGYKISDNLPDYRHVRSNPKADLDDGMHYQANSPLPTTILPPNFSELLLKFRLYNGVQSLEQTASGEYGDYLSKEFAEDFSNRLSKEIQKNGYQLSVHNVKMLTHISEVSQALGEIRSRLLELMLKLEKQYPSLEKDLKKENFDKNPVNQKIIQIMNQTNITTTGDSNIVNTGNNNTFNVNTKINKGDIDGLTKALKELKVSEEDIKEAVEIVKVDEPIVETKTLGPQSRGWISKMIDKTLDGTWLITTGAAGGLLVELFKHFFGIQ
jgi:hypothetical protein